MFYKSFESKVEVELCSWFLGDNTGTWFTTHLWLQINAVRSKFRELPNGAEISRGRHLTSGARVYSEKWLLFFIIRATNFPHRSVLLMKLGFECKFPFVFFWMPVLLFCPTPTTPSFVQQSVLHGNVVEFLSINNALLRELTRRMTRIVEALRSLLSRQHALCNDISSIATELG